jgi:hypothetical protein
MVQRTGILGYDTAAAAIELARENAYAFWQAPAFAPAWASGTTYGLGATVCVGVGGTVYKSLVAGNIGNAPASSPAQWQSMDFATVQAGIRAADIAYHNAIIALAPQFGITPLASQAALQGLGLAPIPPN